MKIRNPLYADYSPGYSSPNIDSLDQFKNEYNFQENTNAKNQNQYYEDQNLQNVYKQYEELPQKQQTNSNELSKNLANFYGVTPPRTGSPL